MLDPKDPLIGWFDRVVAEGNEDKLNMLRNIYPVVMSEFGETFDAEKFKKRCISVGYGSREAMNVLYPEQGGQAPQPEGK